MSDKKTKRIFADISPDDANEFQIQAKRAGTSMQALLESYAYDYLAGKVSSNKKIPTHRLENDVNSVMQSGHTLAEKLVRIAIQSAQEMIQHAQLAANPRQLEGEHDIPGKIGDAARLAAKARRIAETGGVHSTPSNGRDEARQRTGGGKVAG